MFGLVVGSVATILGGQIVAASCGDSNVEAGEHCDDGGVCIGGPLAGTQCSSEDDCTAGGACFGGLDDLRVCVSHNDCRGGACRRCRPVGGDGCAANCTFENRIEVGLVDGQVSPRQDEIVFGTSGAVIFGPFLTIPLPFYRGSLALTVGGAIHGISPVVIRAGDLGLSAIPAGAGACACIRAATQFTCGGTALELDGQPSTNCSPNQAPTACPAESACAPIHGVGNAGSGFIDCGAHAIDVEVTQDCNATPNAPGRLSVTSTDQSSEPSDPAHGNAMVSLGIGTSSVVGGCSGTTVEYGPDQYFCTDDDPPINLFQSPVWFTTGMVTGTVFNPGDYEDVLGPISIRGEPFACNGSSLDVSSAVLGGVLTTCDLPTVNDIVMPISFAFAPTPTPQPTFTRGSPSPTGTITPTFTLSPTRTFTPTVAVHVITDDVALPCNVEPGARFHFDVSLVGQGVAAIQHKLLFVNTGIDVDTASCTINPAIGPDRPLSIISKKVCGGEPPPSGCPTAAQSNISVIDLQIFGVASLGPTPIPQGKLYSCEGEVVHQPYRSPLSIEDVVASDNRGNRLPARGIGGFVSIACAPSPTPSQRSCAGDCNLSSVVTVDELLTLVSVVLGHQTIEVCTVGDADVDGTITVDEVIGALIRALNGCE